MVCNVHEASLATFLMGMMMDVLQDSGKHFQSITLYLHKIYDNKLEKIWSDQILLQGLPVFFYLYLWKSGE